MKQLLAMLLATLMSISGSVNQPVEAWNEGSHFNELSNYDIDTHLSHEINPEDEATFQDAVTLLLRLNKYSIYNLYTELSLKDGENSKLVIRGEYTDDIWKSPISRYLFTEVLHFYTVYYQKDLETINDIVYMDDYFYDWFETPEIYGKPIKDIIKYGLLDRKENGNFDGSSSVTYEEIATVMCRVINKDERIKLEKLPKEDDFSQLFAEYTTTSTNSKNGNFNINKAAESINDTIVESGGTFSYYETIGNPNKANGYKEANIISGGKYVKGYGGGVCQDATTLFNAALLSNMTIVERRNHGLKSSYVKPGYDATFATGSIDFKFRNDYSTPIKIKANFDYETLKLTVQIYGSKRETIPEVKLYAVGGGHSWELFREVNGEVNYSTKSYYRD